MKKLLGTIFGVAVGAFVASLVVYFFNLDMKVAAVAQPILDKWYDRRVRTPMP